MGHLGGLLAQVVHVPLLIQGQGRRGATRGSKCNVLQERPEASTGEMMSSDITPASFRPTVAVFLFPPPFQSPASFSLPQECKS